VVPFGLADRPHGGLAPFTVHAVDEQHAVEVIGLVLQAAGQVAGGRVRLWRLARAGAAPSPDQAGFRPVSDAELSEVARGLEDESYRRWLDQRDTAPAPWRRDEAFSQVVYLTPDEMAGMAEVIRALLAQYRHREIRPAARPPEAAPVAVVARLFPLLEPGAAP
jgi:hypothetical protein